ncbi:MAG: sensor domain-containing diguanylate cyclase [Vicinamibacteria bacterium]
MTPEIDSVKADLAATRQDLENLRLEFPDALLEGEIATERVLFMNRLACQVFRCTLEEALVMTARDIFAEGDYERAQTETRRRIEQGYRDGGGARYVRTATQDLREFRMQRRDGTTFQAETHSTFILDAAGRPDRMRTIVRDITARKEMEARLEELSFRDPLTGCYNRRYLDRRRGELEEDRAPLACLLFDLTGFKKINDTYGHEEGDRVLQAFAHFLLRLHRSNDILVRLGGDEFALFIRTAGESEARAVADRVTEETKKESPAACNLGVALRLPGEDLAGVMARADQVMYAAKGRSLRSTRRPRSA